MLADRLGIDLELSADSGTRAPLGVEPGGPLGQIGAPDPSRSRYLVPLQKGQDRRPMDRVGLGQIQDGGAEFVLSDQLAGFSR